MSSRNQRLSGALYEAIRSTIRNASWKKQEYPSFALRTRGGRACIRCALFTPAREGPPWCEAAAAAGPRLLRESRMVVGARALSSDRPLRVCLPATLPSSRFRQGPSFFSAQGPLPQRFTIWKVTSVVMHVSHSSADSLQIIFRF